MAHIQIKLSQSVVNQDHALSTASPSSGSLSSLIDSVIQIDYLISADYHYYSSWSMSGGTMLMSFPDGSTGTYGGVVLSNPSAASGTATATSFNFYSPNAVSISTEGILNWNYQISGGYLFLNPTSETWNAYSIATLFPPGSAGYDPTFGNESLGITGAVTTDYNHNMSGTITSITESATSFIQSASIQGSFSVSGNALAIGQNLASSHVSGMLTGVSEYFYDGSYATVDGLGSGVYLANDQPIDSAGLSGLASTSADDVINVSLPQTVYENYVITTGSGNNTVTIQGGGASLSVQGGAGNDTMTVLDHGHSVDGGGGSNSVIYDLALSSETIQKSGGSYMVSDGTGSDTLTNVQQIQFTDMTVNTSIQALSTTIGASSLTLLEETYIAFFNRIPDANGLQYWITQLASGQSMDSIGNNFYLVGIQYSALTGYTSTMTNTDFINKVYANVLGRSSGADAGGLAYWNDALSTGTSRATLVEQILVAAHTYAGDPTWGWVASLLNNKDAVAQEFAVTLGLNYNDAATSISGGMAIAAAITPTDTSAAIALIGVNPANIHLT